MFMYNGPYETFWGFTADYEQETEIICEHSNTPFLA